jgi:hypothetical protein
MSRKILAAAALSAGVLLLSGCGGSGYNSYYVAPQNQQKDLNQVAKDSVSHLSAQETAQLNKLGKK